MTHTLKNRSTHQLLLAIVLASSLAASALVGCGQESAAPSGLGSEPSGQEVTSETQSLTASEGQTAPMPDHVIQESEIIGCWSPDVNAQQPIFIDFYLKDGKLWYDYYQIVLGDGTGFGLANGHSKFEYNHGEVAFYGNQGKCLCLVTDSNEGYVGFYLDSIADGVIYDQEDGDPFYYVGTECPYAEGNTRPY